MNEKLMGWTPAQWAVAAEIYSTFLILPKPTELTAAKQIQTWWACNRNEAPGFHIYGALPLEQHKLWARVLFSAAKIRNAGHALKVKPRVFDPACERFLQHMKRTWWVVIKDDAK